MAKANLTKKADINTTIREVDFVTSFQKTWQTLREIMGIMRPVRKTPGTKLVSYEAKVALHSGNVGEGEEIPYSKASVIPVAYADLTIEKYAKAVSIEAVERYGAANAVTRTDDAFRNELTSKVLDRFYAFLQTGSLKSTETTFQMAISMAMGKVVDKFRKMRRDYTRVAVFVNTLDVYSYLGAADITIQNAFGIQYVENFLGADIMIISSEIPQGTVIATPVENIILYYIDPGDSDFAQLGLNYTVAGEETNLIGFHAEGNYKTAVGESYALLGMTLWAEYLDAISVVTIGATKASVTINKEEATVAVGGTVALTAATVPANGTVVWTSSDTNIATVSDGTVTGVASGVVTIKASVAATGASDECKVTVIGTQGA